MHEQGESARANPTVFPDLSARCRLGAPYYVRAIPSERSRSPHPRQPLLHVVPGQHLLAELPPLSFRRDVAGVSQIERVRSGRALGIIAKSGLEFFLILDPVVLEDVR
ncbi:hypothetical protein GGD67_002327 [Bradyrhizobium sp. IAR9]|nr:hypothetical protein [Bradyrhizobium sp. IAR9]